MCITVVRTFALILFLGVFAPSVAQQKYWVFFNDKKKQDLDPYSYFDKKAIERRLRNGVPLYDYSDLPLNEEYISAVNEVADSVAGHSRWFNALCVFGNEDLPGKLAQFKFVREVKLIPNSTSKKQVLLEEESIKPKMKKLGEYQVNVLGSEYTRAAGMDGNGIRIAVFDAGFTDVDENKAFAHLFSGKKILMTYDFIRKKDQVYSHSHHGTMVLSCIAGVYDSLKMGLATNAEFLLARTEHNYREPEYEEDKWIMAAEWADKNGADIISSSLGYTEDRYTQSDLNGKSMLSKAATLAARKGMLVVNAAGNDGDGSWMKLGIPADADSILTVGGTDPKTGYHIKFSSYGPTADGRLKPNVSAPGEVTAAMREKLAITQGTSFSTPLITGYAACVLQMHKDWPVMKLISEIEKSGRLYPYFDYAHGYGIPTFKYFVSPDSVSSTFEVEVKEESILVTPGRSLLKGNAADVLYYHIRDQQGRVLQYFVLKVESSETFTMFPGDPGELKGKIVSIHFKGYTKELRF